MKILFTNETNFVFNKNLLEKIETCILETLNLEDFSKNVEVSLTVVDNLTIKELNKQYRNIDKETDVLSFPLLEEFENIDTKNIIALGDIIISIDKAKAQALDYGHSLERELCFLTVHSMLHLLGYDHMEKEEEKIMFSKQDLVLNKLNIIR